MLCSVKFKVEIGKNVQEKHCWVNAPTDTDVNRIAYCYAIPERAGNNRVFDVEIQQIR